MNDQQLATFAEKLYGAVLTTRLPLGAIPLTVFAVQQGIPWARLPIALKVSVMKIAAQCLDDLQAGPPSDIPVVLCPEGAPQERGAADNASPPAPAAENGNDAK